MHDLFKLYKVGLIGDSHVVRMKSYIPGYIKVIARGGEQAKNLRNYQEEIKDLDILVAHKDLDILDIPTRLVALNELSTGSSFFLSLLCKLITH